MTIKTKQRNKTYFKTDNLVIYNDDILKLNTLPNNYVDLIVTSPPYNVDIHYNSHADNLSYEDYLEFTKKWMKKGRVPYRVPDPVRTYAAGKRNLRRRWKIGTLLGNVLIFE